MWCLSLIAAHAADPEADRLAESLYLAARDGEWRAVERRYNRLVDDHPAGLTGAIHQMASQASRTRGELLLTAQRLMRVRETDPEHEGAQGSLKVLSESAGLVMIKSTPAALEPEAPPFLPDLKLAIEIASADLQEDGIYVGLIPAGTYTIAGEPFEVAPGFTWNVHEGF